MSTFEWTIEAIVGNYDCNGSARWMPSLIQAWLEFTSTWQAHGRWMIQHNWYSVCRVFCCPYTRGRFKQVHFLFRQVNVYIRMNLLTLTVRLEPRNYHGSFRRCVLSLLTQFNMISCAQFKLTVLKSEHSVYWQLRQLNITPELAKGLCVRSSIWGYKCTVEFVVMLSYESIFGFVFSVHSRYVVTPCACRRL